MIHSDNTMLAKVYHEAKIDLPHPAGEWNTFSLPSSDDWIKAFKASGEGRFVRIHDGLTGFSVVETKYQGSLDQLYEAGDKDGYRQLMVKIFKEADRIKVFVESVYNIYWPAWDIEHIKSEIERDLTAA
jgi:hypothetical protein